MVQTRRFPAPWRVEEKTESFIVQDANGFPVAYTYFEADEERRAPKIDCMTRDEGCEPFAALVRELSPARHCGGGDGSKSSDLRDRKRRAKERL